MVVPLWHNRLWFSFYLSVNTWNLRTGPPCKHVDELKHWDEESCVIIHIYCAHGFGDFDWLIWEVYAKEMRWSWWEWSKMVKINKQVYGGSLDIFHEVGRVYLLMAEWLFVWYHFLDRFKLIGFVVFMYVFSIKISHPIFIGLSFIR